jgi:hypothetical protein
MPDALAEAVVRVDQLRRLARRVVAGEAKSSDSVREEIDNLHEVLLDCEMFYYGKRSVIHIL